MDHQKISCTEQCSLTQGEKKMLGDLKCISPIFPFGVCSEVWSLHCTLTLVWLWRNVKD